MDVTPCYRQRVSFLAATDIFYFIFCKEGRKRPKRNAINRMLNIKEEQETVGAHLSAAKAQALV